jgi:hypothetical protein
MGRPRIYASDLDRWRAWYARSQRRALVEDPPIPSEVAAARERRAGRAARRLPNARPTEWWIGVGPRGFTQTDYSVLLGGPR